MFLETELINNRQKHFLPPLFRGRVWAFRNADRNSQTVPCLSGPLPCSFLQCRGFSLHSGRPPAVSCRPQEATEKAQTGQSFLHGHMGKFILCCKASPGELPTTPNEAPRCWGLGGHGVKAMQLAGERGTHLW